MYAYTCAHREYPFGSRLRITNISNNRTVQCLVNDRGPFVAGRDIDLSYAAAREIGLLNAGVATVRIEHIGRDNSYVTQVLYASDRGPFTIQIGSFREIENARRLKESLDLKYRGTYITKTAVKGSSFYRVRIGKFAMKNDVASLAAALADEGYNVLVTRYDEKI
jgi:rare lipoprotein A